MAQRRQLAAIMFTDMIGYTALMGSDEVLAGKLRSRHREVIKKYHAEFHGEIIQYFGDGTLSIFKSSVEALKCAIITQRELRKDPVVPLRIGLHSGELVWDDNDVYGSAVNIASRLETFAVEGAILTSSRLREELSNQLEFSFESLGRFQLKNVPKPMEIFAVANEGITVPDRTSLEGKGKRIKEGESLTHEAAPPPISEEGIAVNDILIDVICEDLAVYNRNLDDELNKENLDIAAIKREIIDIFPTPIGEELRILFTRSNSSNRSEAMEYFSVNRLKQLYRTVWTSLRFVSFIMLSQLWDEKYNKRHIEMSKEQEAIFNAFFSINSKNYQTYDYAQIINTISAIFEQNQTKCFIEELKSFKIASIHNPELADAHAAIKQMHHDVLNKAIAPENIEDLCLKAEENLGIILKNIAFLVSYKLVTIKNIEIVKRRHEAARYRHKQINLNRALTVASTGVAEVGIELDNFADNKSVLFIKADNLEIKEYLNLTPFIIDENAINGHLSSKIFQYIYYENNRYHYQFMNNPSDKPLEVSSSKYPKIKKQFDRFWSETFNQEIKSGNQIKKNRGGSRFSRKR
jgi:class 3 adenylate cyclase